MLDYIIVGQGIAGTTLAYQLLKAGQKIVVIDNNPKTSSSKISSGLWNPVVLKRMKKVWLADQMIKELIPFYNELGEYIKTSLVDDLKIHRILFNKEELNNWHENADSLNFKEILNTNLIENKHDNVHADLGFGQVNLSGRVKVQQMLSAFREKLIEKDAYLESEIDYDQIKVQNDFIEINGLKAKNIIFCEGYQSINNPWFNYLPFSLTKGEVAVVKSKTLKIKNPIHGGKFILPLEKDTFKIGATYNWNETDEVPTEKGVNQLKKGWEKITTTPFQLEKHQAGIRPTVQDRRPLLGTHPTNKNIHIFNGLGSRGILMAPYLSKCLTEYLMNKTPLHEEMDISRCLKEN